MSRYLGTATKAHPDKVSRGRGTQGHNQPHKVIDSRTRFHTAKSRCVGIQRYTHFAKS